MLRALYADQFQEKGNCAAGTEGWPIAWGYDKAQVGRGRLQPPGLPVRRRGRSAFQLRPSAMLFKVHLWSSFKFSTLLVAIGGCPAFSSSNRSFSH